MRGARPGPGKMQSILARRQLEHGFFLSHLTLRLRQVTHDRGFGVGPAPPPGEGPLMLPLGLCVPLGGLWLCCVLSDIVREVDDTGNSLFSHPDVFSLLTLAPPCGLTLAARPWSIVGADPTSLSDHCVRTQYEAEHSRWGMQSLANQTMAHQRPSRSGWSTMKDWERDGKSIG